MEARAKILDVNISRNPVKTEEVFIISVGVLFWEPEEPKHRLAFRFGRKYTESPVSRLPVKFRE